MIFRKKQNPADAGLPDGTVVLHPFDDRLGRTAGVPQISAQDAEMRWATGEEIHLLPAHDAGDVVPWSLTARRGRDYVVNEYAADGRRVRSERWVQDGDRVRMAGGEARFEQDGDQGPTAYQVEWDAYPGGAMRIETIAPRSEDDQVTGFRSAPEARIERPAPTVDTVLDLRDSDDLDAAAFAGLGPREAAELYARSRARGAAPLTTEDVFGEASLRTGAVVLASARQIMDVVDGILHRGRATDGVMESRVPVLQRGAATIVPLGAQGAALEYQADVRAELVELSNSVRWAIEHRAGSRVSLDLADAPPSGERSYRSQLVTAGATRAGAWRPEPGLAVVLVVSGDPDAGTLTHALHIVPSGWVASPDALERPLDEPIDVAWSWADVVSLASSW
ncbi:hypothetical protein [Microbacterium sp. LWH11-1.2]|uniref:hypothetical protein n=1 Tax=Microbacterium sp. LWH11-1.2 TaxID=3135258 RepID=UPI0031399C6E